LTHSSQLKDAKSKTFVGRNVRSELEVVDPVPKLVTDEIASFRVYGRRVFDSLRPCR
jgi:hypothetical protein